MANLRSSITMTAAEVTEFVEGGRTATLATIGKDGRPHLASMWFAVLDDQIVMHTQRKSQKVLNIQRDPRITVLLEAGDSYTQLRGVSIDGTAELIGGDRDYLRLVATNLAARYDTQPTSSEALDQLVRNRVAIVVHVSRTRSWDHRKLGAAS